MKLVWQIEDQDWAVAKALMDVMGDHPFVQKRRDENLAESKAPVLLEPTRPLPAFHPTTVRAWQRHIPVCGGAAFPPELGEVFPKPRSRDLCPAGPHGLRGHPPGCFHRQGAEVVLIPVHLGELRALD